MARMHLFVPCNSIRSHSAYIMRRELCHFRTMTTPPTTMKAWQYSSTKGGLPKNLSINPNTPVPKPGADQILMKIKAVALNPVGYKPAEVTMLHQFAFPKPAIPRLDFVGTVVTAPAGAKLKRGQVVFGVTKNAFAGAALAEYAITTQDRAVPLGKDTSPAEGASMGIAGLTAYQSILSRAKPNSRIFINGGSGGLGTFGIQIARNMGHQVTVTYSTHNVELCESLGAEVIDYTKGSLLDVLKQATETEKFDLIIDNVFADTNLFWKAHEYTNPSAPYVLAHSSHHHHSCPSF